MPRGILNPRGTWADRAAYDAAAADLRDRFGRNFKQFEDDVDDGVRAVAPRAA